MQNFGKQMRMHSIRKILLHNRQLIYLLDLPNRSIKQNAKFSNLNSAHDLIKTKGAGNILILLKILFRFFILLNVYHHHHS